MRLILREQALTLHKSMVLEFSRVKLIYDFIYTRLKRNSIHKCERLIEIMDNQNQATRRTFFNNTSIWNIDEKNYEREIFWLEEFEKWENFKRTGIFLLNRRFWPTETRFIYCKTYCLANQDILGNLIKEIRLLILKARE